MKRCPRVIFLSGSAEHVDRAEAMISDFVRERVGWPGGDRRMIGVHLGVLMEYIYIYEY